VIVFIGDLFDYLCQNSARTDIEFPKFRELINSRQPISFYNWECPIRSPVRPVDGSPLEFECDFFDDEASIERTRLVALAEQEKGFVERVLIPLRDGLGVKTRYFKFLADTNPFLLYPKTCENRKNELEIRRKMLSFAQRLQNKADSIAGYGNIQISPFSQIYSLYTEDYSRAYNGSYYSFSSEEIPQTKLIPQKIFRDELKELASHTRASLETDKGRLVELAKRVVSSYAAEEYVIRSTLSKTDWFQNPTCIPNESIFTLPVLANAYLGKENRGTWLFLFKTEGQKNEKIEL
jgi:hypothetical protein